MFILNSFSIGFSSLFHSVVFVVCIFSFRKTERFYASATERLRQRGKIEIRSNVNKNMRMYLLCMKKDGSSVDEKVIKK